MVINACTEQNLHGCAKAVSEINNPKQQKIPESVCGGGSEVNTTLQQPINKPITQPWLPQNMAID